MKRTAAGMEVCASEAGPSSSSSCSIAEANDANPDVKRRKKTKRRFELLLHTVDQCISLMAAALRLSRCRRKLQSVGITITNDTVAMSLKQLEQIHRELTRDFQRSCNEQLAELINGCALAELLSSADDLTAEWAVKNPDREYKWRSTGYPSEDLRPHRCRDLVEQRDLLRAQLAELGKVKEKRTASVEARRELFLRCCRGCAIDCQQLLELAASIRQ